MDAMNPVAQDKPGETDARVGTQKGNTQSEQGDTTVPTPVPRLPHEHDESADNQAAAERPSAERTQQAFRDLERGVVDTDRRSAYENQEIAGRLDQRNVERRKQPRK